MKVTFSEFKMEDCLNSEEMRKEYLNQVLADGDTKELKRALCKFTPMEFETLIDTSDATVCI